MSRIFRLIAFIFFVLTLALSPRPVLACVEGLSWGMDLSSLEMHLGVDFEPIHQDLTSDLFEIQNFKMSNLPVKIFRVRIDDQYGLKQIAFEMDYENMTEVLAGLRNRFGPPVGASFDVDGDSSQQQWIWHTGEDVITAVKSQQRSFLLSYRPSLLDPAFL